MSVIPVTDAAGNLDDLATDHALEPRRRKSETLMMRHRSPLILLTALLLCGATVPPAGAEVPTYRLDVVTPLTTTTNLRGASDAGHLVGEQVVAGYARPFVATLAAGVTLLPLPDGFLAGIALDANADGAVVGTVADNGFPWDLGEPALWTPDGAGGYEVTLLDYPALVDASGQLRPTDGGQAVAINDAGQMVGFARLQGFQGGPAMQFSTTAEPVNLGALGFAATPRALSDQGVVVGDGLRLDLASGTVTDLGLPEPADGVPFSRVIAYDVNDAGEVVAAADLASNPHENYLTYLHDDASGWQRLDPEQLPSRFVGFYDNNDRGDVSAAGGILFREEEVRVDGYGELLEASFAAWDPVLGHLDNDRRVATTASTDGQTALVVLTPLTAGDANLDDLVDVDDLLLVAASYGQAGTAWAGGDFDRSGTTDLDDLVLMAAHYDDDTPLDGLGLDPAFLADWEQATGGQDVTGVPAAAAVSLTAHPNPFNPRTTIRLAGLPADATGSVRVYTLRGELLRTLHEGPLTRSSFRWDGRDHRGLAVAAGVYLVEGRAAGVRAVTKVTLAK